MRNVSQSELIHQFAIETGLSEDLAKRYWVTMVNVVKQSLLDGNRVTLRGLGSFKPYESQSRRIRNPHTLELGFSEGRRLVSFKLSHVFRDQLNK